jgi:hypothetical protein
MTPLSGYGSSKDSEVIPKARELSAATQNAISDHGHAGHGHGHR